MEEEREKNMQTDLLLMAPEGEVTDCVQVLGWETEWMLVPFTHIRNPEGVSYLSMKSMGSILEMLFEVPLR